MTPRYAPFSTRNRHALADASYPRMSELLDLGADGYLIKGLFDRDCFLRTIERYAGPPRTEEPTLLAPWIA